MDNQLLENGKSVPLPILRTLPSKNARFGYNFILKFVFKFGEGGWNKLSRLS